MWTSLGSLFQTFYSYNLLSIYNFRHFSFCRNQILMPHKCQAEERRNFVWPADDTPVYKVTFYRVTLVKSSQTLVLSYLWSLPVSSEDVVSSFCVQASGCCVKPACRRRSSTDTNQTSLCLSFHTCCEPGHVVTECSCELANNLHLFHQHSTWLMKIPCEPGTGI